MKLISKKSMLSFIATILMMAMVLQGCSSSAETSTSDSESTSTETTTETTTETASEDSTETKTIYIFQQKVEIDSQLKAAAAEYSALHPGVEFQIESTSNDFQTTLKTKFAGGQAPDIFNVAGGNDLALWQDHLADLSNEEWSDSMVEVTKANASIDGVNYLFPLSVEAYGMLYHKDLFEQAGIESLPTTLSEFIDVCEALTAAGIVPTAEQYNGWYAAGNFGVNMAFARQEDPTAFVEGLADGSTTIVGNEIFAEVANFMAVDASYTDNPLSTDYNTQLSNFGNSLAAMAIGGNWTQTSMDEIDPEMEIGIMPIPVSEDAEANDKMYLTVSYWGVNKDSENAEIAKDFINWLATTEEGNSYITDEFKFISGIQGVEASDDVLGVLGTTVAEYVAAGKAYGNCTPIYPDGGAQSFGEAAQKMVAGESTQEEFLQDLQDIWMELSQY